jgi:hypothetical protein
LLPASTPRASAQTGSDFDIDAAFATFMADLGRTPRDGGGAVSFSGRDPILRSHFRIGSSMALPAMAAAVGAAAIWKDRTGEGQDTALDVREALMNVNPLITPMMQFRMASGAVPADDPVGLAFSFTPTINGNLLQAPVGLGNPFSFRAVPHQGWPPREHHRRLSHLMTRALSLLETYPTRPAIAAAVARWDRDDLEAAMFEEGVVGVLHRTTEEWLAHPEGAFLSQTPLIQIRKVGEAPPLEWGENPTQPLSGLQSAGV